jgi:hypothetical protein
VRQLRALPFKDDIPEHHQHAKAIYAEGELTEGATCKELLQVRRVGDRELGCRWKHDWGEKLDAFLRFNERERC